MADADMKRCAEIGAEVFVLDAGWYNKMTYRLGQSEPSATFKPRGLDAERRYRVLENGQFQSLRSGRDLATNGIAVKQWDKLIRLRIPLYFDNVFVSGEMGREKDERFFRSVLKTLKAKPKDCVMVGDREDTDILPAKSAGIQTIRVMGAKHGKGDKTASKADISIPGISALPSALRALELF